VRQRRGGVVPLSKDPQARARQLANLRDPKHRERQTAKLVPGAGAAAPGEQRALAHGAYARILRSEQQEQEALIFEALAADAPLRDGDGGLPAADAMIVGQLAEYLIVRDRLKADIARHGEWESRGKRKGQERPAVRRLSETWDRIERLSHKLGMDPVGRARLGVDLARTVDLATAMSEPDPARRAELLAQAGLGGREGGDGDR